MDKYFAFQDIQAFYRDQGEGQTVVFVHGFCGDGSIWDDFAKEAASNQRILIPDLPGYRNSGFPNGGIAMDNLADYLVAVLDDAGVERAILICHSMGGYVAMNFARRYSERITGLCLFHSHVYADDEEKKKGRLKAVEFVKNHGAPKFAKQLYSSLFAPSFKKTHPEVVSNWLAHVSHNKDRSVIASLQAMHDRVDESETLKNLKVPMLFIIGRQDVSISHKRSMGQTALPAIAHVHLLNDVVHMGMLEASSIAKHVVRKYLNLFS